MLNFSGHNKQNWETTMKISKHEPSLISCHKSHASAFLLLSQAWKHPDVAYSYFSGIDWATRTDFPHFAQKRNPIEKWRKSYINNCPRTTQRRQRRRRRSDKTLGKFLLRTTISRKRENITEKENIAATGFHRPAGRHRNQRRLCHLFASLLAALQRAVWILMKLMQIRK